MQRWLQIGCFALVVALASLTSGCKPKIGDDCDTALDCSTLGDRLCDNTQPGGYCTIFNCEPDTCPDEASCVAFNQDLDPACREADDGQHGRFGTTFCMRSCESESDCRAGYACVRPADQYAQMLDVKGDKSSESKVCLALGAPPEIADAPPAACFPGKPDPLVPYTPAQGGGGAGGSSQGGSSQGGMGTAGAGGHGGGNGGSGG